MNSSILAIDVPIESGKCDLFSGDPVELEIIGGKIILPPDIVSVIESRQKNLDHEDRGLVYINDFFEEHRCFPYNEVLSNLAKKYEPFAWFLTYVPQRAWVNDGRITLPKYYHDCKNVLLVPGGRYFALRDVISQ